MSIWFDSMVFLKNIKLSHNLSNISSCLCLFKTWNYVPIDAYLSWIKYSRSEKLLILISFRKEFHHRCVTREKCPYCGHPWVNFPCKISLRPLSCSAGECLLKCPNSKLPCPKKCLVRHTPVEHVLLVLSYVICSFFMKTFLFLLVFTVMTSLQHQMGQLAFTTKQI